MVHHVAMRADALRNRRRILDAARALVAEHGAEVSMDAIAERAGVAVGTLYRHHPTKADLIAAVVEDSVEAIATAAEQAVGELAAGGDAATLLTSLFATVAEAHTMDRAVKEALHALEQGAVALEPGAVATDPATAPEGSATARAASAIEQLLAAGRDAGTLRADLTVDDLVVLLAGVPDGDAARRDRYVALVTAALVEPT